jgi:hypothetical protein
LQITVNWDGNIWGARAGDGHTRFRVGFLPVT